MGARRVASPVCRVVVWTACKQGLALHDHLLDDKEFTYSTCW